MNRMIDSTHIPQIQVLCNQLFIYMETETFTTNLELHIKGL